MRTSFVIDGGGPGGPFQCQRAKGTGPDVMFQTRQARDGRDRKAPGRATKVTPVAAEGAPFEVRGRRGNEAKRLSCRTGKDAHRFRNLPPSDFQMRGSEIGYLGVSAAAMAAISDHYAGPTD